MLFVPAQLPIDGPPTASRNGVMMIEITTYVQSPGSFRAIYTPKLGPLFVTARTPPTALGAARYLAFRSFPDKFGRTRKGRVGSKS